MVKKVSKFLSIMTGVVLLYAVIIVSCVTLVTSCGTVDKKKERILFQEHKSAFEQVNSIIMKAFCTDVEDNSELEWECYIVEYEETYIKEQKTIVGLYDFPFELSDKDVEALNEIAPLVHGFESIDASKERIAYHDLGKRAYVYSVNGEEPTYFFQKGDGIDFKYCKLNEHWYFLSSNLR